MSPKSCLFLWSIKEKKLEPWQLAIFKKKVREMLFEMKLEYLSLKKRKLIWHELMKLISEVFLRLWCFVRNDDFGMTDLGKFTWSLLHQWNINVQRKTCGIGSKIILKNFKEETTFFYQEASWTSFLLWVMTPVQTQYIAKLWRMQCSCTKVG